MFANYTHITVSLLKAWKVTVVRMECDDVTLRGSIYTRKCSFKKIYFFKTLQARCQTGLYSTYSQESLLPVRASEQGNVI